MQLGETCNRGAKHSEQHQKFQTRSWGIHTNCIIQMKKKKMFNVIKVTGDEGIEGMLKV